MNKLTALKALLALVCVTHLALGLIAFTGIAGICHGKIASGLYGVTVTVTPSSALHSHPGSVHARHRYHERRCLVQAAAEQGHHRRRGDSAALAGVAAILFAQQLHDVFSLSYGRLWVQAIFFLALALALFFLRPRSAT